MSSGLTAYTCTPRETKAFVIDCMMAGLVPFIQSSPAMGKSAIVAQIAREYNLKLIDHRLSTSAPEDLSGLPHFKNGVASFVPFDTFPVEGTELPLWPGETERKFDAEGNCINCYAGWLLFLDEFNSATKMVQAAAYKLVLDEMVGQTPLHANVRIVCAGNLATDRAIVNPISTAMQSRLIHITMQMLPGAAGVKEFLQDVALPQKWDMRIVAYLSYRPGALHDFRPDHNEKTFCAPRTWEFMHKLIRGKTFNFVKKMDENGHPIEVYEMEAKAALFAGAITSGEAVNFITFTKVFHSLPKVKDIVDDPTGTTVPTDGATRFATITHLVEHVDDKNFDPIAEYINRFTAEFRVLFFRALMIQKPELKKHQAFRKAMVDLSRYLHDDIAAAA
ncbi:MAG: ATP-binding protein [Mesorhizobium sp.]|uniref:hypothetical protein n=1 Tax=Mesorhizobium sp. TaxID=1871066 RepID=UPI00120D703E|nr:hypothetical protein [Mesorhizobium sp.]TIN00999.1 MAG: ATP-binding protein [Mesorhizobium sp.]